MHRTITLSLAIIAAAGRALAQDAPLRFKQERDGDSIKLLSAGEFVTLGDPLFNLLLKTRADVTKLADVEKALQPQANRRRLFVVDEHIVSDAKSGGRRAVLAFNGSNGGEPLQGNVMLSFSFGPDGPTDAGDIEAWGWDNHRSRYNYYKLDAEGAPVGRRTWKFRGSSQGADLLAPGERKGTCLRCHPSGAPVMKELFLPWNNWHSVISFKADYLVAGSGHPAKWPAAETERLKESLAGAEELETNFIIPAIKRFNTSRLNSALQRQDATGDRLVSPNGRMTILEGRRLLRPLFETTEINLISSKNTSGFHPFDAPNSHVPQLPILLPENFFLNTHLIAGSQGNITGLGLQSAKDFQNFARLTQEENKRLVEKFKVRLNAVAGDTRFAWFVPEPGFIDNNLADQLLRTGAVTPHFLASVLAVDLETPIFSAKRVELLKFVPDRYEFTPVAMGANPLTIPREAEKDLLTKEVIAAIERAAPAAGSTADEFRKFLKSDDAVKALEQRVKEYAKRVRKRLDPADAEQRAAELERLYDVLIKRRRAMLEHPVFRNLDETGGRLLLPLPPAD